MNMRRAHEIVAAGLTLVGGDLVLAQAVPAKSAPSPYHARTVQPIQAESTLPAPTGVVPIGAVQAEGAGIYPGLAANYGMRSYGASPGPGMPLGESLALHMRAQVGNAAVARMTLYDYDFVNGSSRLNYRGRDRLMQIANRLTTMPYPLIVERLPFDPDLTFARRTEVQVELAALGLKLPPDRVLVGPPIAVPLRGVEAEGIYGTLMLQTESAGFQPGVSPTGGARTATQSGGGSGSGATPSGR